PGGQYWTSVFPARYPGVQAKPFEVWQVWNEQNAPKHTHPLSPSAYARLVQLSHSAITSRDPNAEILLGGMFGQPTGAGAFEAWDFLNAVYETPGARDSFDAVALHPYSPTIDGIKEQVNKMRSVLRKHADKRAKKKLKKAKKRLRRAKRGDNQAKVKKAMKRVKKAKKGLQTTDIWVSEIGWGSEGASTSRLVKGLEGQAVLLKKSFELFEKQRKKWRIGGVLWYTWRDLNPVGAPCDWCASAGLFGQNGFTPKPAWNEYVRLTGGS
ncbi:MAG: hypothetical protein ACRDL1_04515, partial [Solirubrobacterales bacterium]